MNKTLLVALAALLALASCGGEALSIWKVSATPGARPASCYKDGKITDTTSETTTIETYLGEWELYQAANGAYQLHVSDSTNDFVLDGTKEGGTYTFTGTHSTIQVDNAENPTVTNTTTIEQKIVLDVGGDSFTGTWAHTTTKRCEGTPCPATFQADNPDCTLTDAIKGSKVAVQIVHED